MPRKRKEAKTCQHSQELMKTANKAIAGGMKISQAAKDYNIPRMTLSDHWSLCVYHRTLLIDYNLWTLIGMVH